MKINKKRPEMDTFKKLAFLRVTLIRTSFLVETSIPLS